MLKKVIALAMTAVLALSLAACGAGAGTPSAEPSQEPVDLAAFGDGFVTAEQVPPLLDVESDMGKQVLEMSYPGLSELELEQFLAYVSMMSINNSELVLAQAKSEEDAAKVQEIFQTRIDSMVNGGAFYPETTEIWTNNAEVVTNGSYVALVVGADKDAIVEQFNALFQ